MRDFASLPVRTARSGVLALSHSEPHAEPWDPADEVFTDLRTAPSVTVPASEGLDDSLWLMQRAGVRMAFVIDASGGAIGLVTAADLQGERPMLMASSRFVSREDLCVGDVMTPVAHWVTLDADTLRTARVGHVLETFRATGQRYLIVTEESTPGEGDGSRPRTFVRGLFSANRVERALGHPIAQELRSSSFAALAAALAHS